MADAVLRAGPSALRPALHTTPRRCPLPALESRLSPASSSSRWDNNSMAPGKAAGSYVALWGVSPVRDTGRGPGSERQGAPLDDVRVEPISGECRGWNTGGFGRSFISEIGCRLT